MIHIRTAWLAILATIVAPAYLWAASGDQAPYGPIHGRAFSIDVRHYVIDHLPGPTVVTVDQKVQIPEGMTDIQSVCEDKLVEIFCAPETFLGKCDTVETSYSFVISPGVSAFGTVTNCAPADAGQCVEVSGRMLGSKELPLLESVDVVPDTCSFSL